MQGGPSRRKAIFDRLVDVLRDAATPTSQPITEATELYYDLGLHGDDLYDALDEVSREFRVDFSLMDLGRYAPGETGHAFSLNLVRTFREWRGERTYRSLTVGSLVDAVQAGVWRDR